MFCSSCWTTVKVSCSFLHLKYVKICKHMCTNVKYSYFHVELGIHCRLSWLNSHSCSKFKGLLNHSFKRIGVKSETGSLLRLTVDNYVFTQTHTHTHTHLCVCMCVCVCVCTHTHTHTHTYMILASYMLYFINPMEDLSIFKGITSLAYVTSNVFSATFVHINQLNWTSDLQK